MIPQNVIDEVLDRVSIVDLIGRYVDIKKSGRNYLALCPFHQEKSPSFSLSEEKGLYHCFGCGASGNSLKFLMDYQKLTFIEAVKDLAKMAGIDLDQYSDAGVTKGAGEKDLLFQINSEAMQYFHKLLLTSPEAGQARGYLKGRKITLETVKTYRLGFGGTGWSGLSSYLKEKGFKDNDMIKAGVVSQGNNGLYDRFKDRVIFPIFDRDGKAVGFGGRILTDEKKSAKYLNTAETPVFHKGNLLFSLHLAKDEMVKQKRVILAEGYMDVIALHQNGIKNAVAPLGTALTEAQLAVLKRFCDAVFFIFDGDSAGIKAANRAVDIAVNSNLTQWVVILPGGKDPDDYVMQYGPEAFGKYMEEKKLAPVDFKMRYFSKMMDMKNEKVKFLAEMFAYLVKVQSAVQREDHIKKIAGFIQEDYETILAEYKAFLKNNKSIGRVIKQAKPNGSSINPLELEFIGILAAAPERVNETSDVVLPEMIESADVGKIYRKLLESTGLSTKDLVSLTDREEIVRKTAELAMAEAEKPYRLKELAYQVKLLYIQREMDRVDQMINSNEKSSTVPAKDDFREKRILTEMRDELKEALKKFALLD